MRLKLLFIPRYHCDPDTGKKVGTHTFPPLSTAVLTGFLRQHNFSVEQDDLDIKVQHYNLTSNTKKKINLKVFMDKKKVKQLIEEKHSPELEREAEKIIKLTKIQDADIIGLSLNPDENLSTTAVAMTLGKIIKEKYGSTILVGGPVGDNTKGALLKSGFVDYTFYRSSVYSISEVALLNFCQSYEKKGEVDIPGVTYLKKGRLVHNLNMDSYSRDEKFIFSMPDFDGLPLDLYKCEVSREIFPEMRRQVLSSKIFFLPYFFVRGCPHRCAFCCYSTRPYSFKDPSEVALDLKELSDRYKTQFFYFLNTSINPTYQYAEKVADELIKNDLNVFWTDCLHLGNLDEKLIKKLKDSGGIRFVFGVESGSTKLLKYFKKSFTLSFAEKVIKKVHNIGVGIQIDVICGFPYETESDVECTMNFIKRNRKYIDWVDVFKFYLDGEFLKYPEKYGIRIKEDDNRLYTHWSTKAFDEIHGLPWKKKIKQTNSFYDRILRTLPEEQRPIHADLLFFFKMHPEAKKGVNS